MNKLVVLLSAKMRSGKDTFAKLLKEELEKKYNQPIAIDSFARPLKEMARDSFKPLIDFLNSIFSNLLKEKQLQSYSYKEVESWITEEKHWWDEKTPISRIILQQLGTDVFRNHVSENYWVEQFRKNVLERKELIVLNSDWRFPSESEYLEEYDNMTILKFRIERNVDRSQAFNEHISETALDDYKNWNMVIENNGTIDDLKNEVKRAVEYIGSYYEK